MHRFYEDAGKRQPNARLYPCCVADFHSRRGALTLDSLVAAVFSASAVEAFTNDLADHVEVWSAAAGAQVFNAATPELIRAVQEVLAIEAARHGDQITAKVRAAGRALTGDEAAGWAENCRN